jgi:4-amino-4-deoxy-L-arabinose transferase-like glycosyltransferase
MNAPLFYWLKAPLILLFGDNLWTMRIVSASFGLLTVLVTRRLACRLAGERAGLIAALVLLTTFQFIHLHSARTGELEPLVGFCFVLAALLFTRGIEGGGFLAHHLCVVALAHIKLPLAALPLLAEGFVFALHAPSREHLGRWLRMGCWVLPLALAWRMYHLVLDWEGFLAVVQQMFSQATGDDQRVARYDIGVVGKLFYYGREMLFGATPMVILAPFAVGGVLFANRRTAGSGGWLVLAANLGVLVAFFLLVAKHLPWYVIPAYPFLAIFVGAWLARLRPTTWELGALGVSVAVLCWLRIPVLEYNPFAALAQQAPVGWARIGPVGPVLGIVGTAAILCGGLASLRTRIPAQPLVAVATAALLIVAGVRVLLPLRFMDYESPMSQLRREIDVARERGEELPYPIVYVKGCERGAMKRRYYFADEFWIVPESDAARGGCESAGARFFLYERSRGAPPKERPAASPTG